MADLDPRSGAPPAESRRAAAARATRRHFPRDAGVTRTIPRGSWLATDDDARITGQTINTGGGFRRWN